MSEFPVLIYDGDCAFCSTSIRIVSRFVQNSPNMIPFQWCNLNSYGLSQFECEKEVKFVTSSSINYGGAQAFAIFFQNCGRPWSYLGKFMNFPVIRFLSSLIYRWIAKNRYRLPGGTPTCGLEK